MSLVVVDASVAAKWFLPTKGETLIEEAFRLLRQYTKGEVRLLMPDLFWAELGNLLWRAMRQGRCTTNGPWTGSESQLGSFISRPGAPVPRPKLMLRRLRLEYARYLNTY